MQQIYGLIENVPFVLAAYPNVLVLANLLLVESRLCLNRSLIVFILLEDLVFHIELHIEALQELSLSLFAPLAFHGNVVVVSDAWKDEVTRCENN